MLPVIRRLVALVATLLLVVATAAPAVAAEPPAGVLLDATVTVSVSGPIVDGAVQPLADAEVTLVAYTNDFPEDPIQELAATTDGTGTAVFSGVARSDAGGPEVFLAAMASREDVEVDGECVTVEFWSGATRDVVAVDGLTIPVETFPGAVRECETPDATPPPGYATDASLAVTVLAQGAPVDATVVAIVRVGAWASVSETVAIDGLAIIDALPRPTEGGPPAEVALEATATIDDAVAGCAFERSARGTTETTLTDPGLSEATIDVEADPFTAPTAVQPVRIVDRDGAPISGSGIFLSQRHPTDEAADWTCHTTSAADGTADLPIYDWGTAEGPSAVDIEAHGPVAFTEVRDECVLSFGPYGLASLQLVTGGELDPVDVTTDIVELDAVCSTTGTPAPGTGVGGGGSGPNPTLPPTDAAGPPTATAPMLPALVLVFGLVAIVGLAAAFCVPAPRR